MVTFFPAGLQGDPGPELAASDWSFQGFCHPRRRLGGGALASCSSLGPQLPFSKSPASQTAEGRKERASEPNAVIREMLQSAAGTLHYTMERTLLVYALRLRVEQAVCNWRCNLCDPSRSDEREMKG